MKTIYLVVTLFSLNLYSQVFDIKDIKCSDFDYYLDQKMCLIVIENETTIAGVLFPLKKISSLFQIETDLIGKKVDANLDKFLQLTYDEEENIRHFIDYPQTRYYQGNQKDFIFLNE